MAGLSVGQKADVIATFRSISVSMMETLAAWTPLTPELEVKLLFGRHLYEFAQHADVLGQRTAELRAGVHYTRPPRDSYGVAFEQCRESQSGGERVAAVYDVLIPDLLSRYRAQLADADPILDQPSIRIIDRICHDLERLMTERREMLTGVDLPVDSSFIGTLRAGVTGAADMVDFRPMKEMAS